MTATPAFTVAQIETAVETAKKNRGAYASLLEFYGPLFIAQEEAKGDIRLDPIVISDDTLSAKRKEKLPLVRYSEFIIDEQPLLDLFDTLCRIAGQANPNMAASVSALQKAVQASRLDPRSLFTALLREDDAFFDAAAQAIGADKQIMAFIAYSCVHPCAALCAEQLSIYLKTGDSWKEGYCPICGSLPGISTLEGEGERFLACSFCWHKWAAPRIGCPFCGNIDSRKLRYAYSEQEKEYRIDICDGCGKYIKTVDARKADRFLYLPLEQVTTLHLDIHAQEKGFESGSHLPLQA